MIIVEYDTPRNHKATKESAIDKQTMKNSLRFSRDTKFNRLSLS
jgi:hypothetical protein